MTNTEKRIASLEAIANLRSDVAVNAEWVRAWGNLRAALFAALPAVYPENIPWGTRQHQAETVSFVAQISGLDKRLAAGTSTEADCLTLEKLSADDLSAINMMPEEVVHLLAAIHRKF